MEHRIDLAALRAVIGIAELVLADEFAVQPGVEARVQRGAVPPRKKPGEPDHAFFHSTRAKGERLQHRPHERKRREWLDMKLNRARRISSALPGSAWRRPPC